MTYLKRLTFSLLLISSIITFAQNDLLISEGRLNGKYSHLDSENKTTTTGEFKDNLRSGKWTVRDSSNQIVLTREYHSIYSFTEKRTNIDQEKEIFSTEFSLKRDSIGLYKFPGIENSNVLWSKRVRSVLPKNQNKILYAQNYLNEIESFLKTEKFTLYANDELSEVLPPENIDFVNSKLLAISLKKDYYFEKASKMMQERIVAVTFHLENKDKGTKTCFHIYYPTDGRRLFSSFNISNDNKLIQNLDDLLFFKDYGEVIYREEHFNPDKSLDLENIDNYKKESDAIKRLILEIDHEYWVGEY